MKKSIIYSTVMMLIIALYGAFAKDISLVRAISVGGWLISILLMVLIYIRSLNIDELLSKKDKDISILKKDNKILSNRIGNLAAEKDFLQQHLERRGVLHNER